MSFFQYHFRSNVLRRTAYSRLADFVFVVRTSEISYLEQTSVLYKYVLGLEVSMYDRRMLPMQVRYCIDQLEHVACNYVFVQDPAA